MFFFKESQEWLFLSVNQPEGGGSDQLDEATVPVFLFSTDKQLWDMLFREETTELDSRYKILKPSQNYRIIEFKKKILQI